MEVGVYDRLNRKVLIPVALTAGVLAAFTMFLLLPHQGTRVPTTGATIRIERPSGKVFQLDFLFGLEVRRQRFNLSEFDRVSLSRAAFVPEGFPRRSGPGTEGLPYGEPGNLVSPRRRSCAECGPTVSDRL